MDRLGELLLGLRLRAERGQGLVEYALILVLIAVVVVAVLSTLGATIQAKFQQVTNALNT